MTHLLVHLVKEISILGPVFLHNMFPFERFMGVLKKYVHVDTKSRFMPRTHVASQKGPLNRADPPSFSVGMVDPAQSS